MNLLDIISKGDGNYYFSSFPEALVYALIGFLVVFIGITLIILIIWLLGLIMRKTNNLAFLTTGKKKKQKPSGVEVEKEIEDNDGAIPDEVKAAIVAAIMAYYCEEKPECEFKVKKIRRI